MIISSIATLYYLIAGIIGIALLITVHEFGHFIFAKLFNISTPSFSIGFGPTIYQKKIGDTLFRIGAIPLGGYVEIAGNEEIGQGEQKEAKRIDERSFQSKNYIQKLFVMLGGIIFNLAFAYLILTLIFATGTPKTFLTYPLNAGTTIKEIAKDSPEEKAGLKSKDKIVKIDNAQVSNGQEIIKILHNINKAESINITFLREDQEKTTKLIFPQKGTFRSKIGALLEPEAILPQSLKNSILLSIKQTNFVIKQIFWLLGSLFKNRTTEGVGGPIMIISQITKSAQQGIKIWLLLLALLSINLAALNILPLPILDGGQILFVTIEAIIRRPLPEKIKLGIAYASWILMLLLIIYLSFKDILSLIF